MKDLDNIERLELRAHFVQILKRSGCEDLRECDRVLVQIEQEIRRATTEYLKAKGKI